MKSSNKNLHKAKTAKNDEFYTQLSDIENELKNYKNQFKNKIVFCNCDDPKESNFWKYFALNFHVLELKKLISTHFDQKSPTYKLEVTREDNPDISLPITFKNNKVENLKVIKTPLKQNGDFRSPECIKLLKETDIVITNPPFSLFREYVNQLIEYDKKFIIIGNKNAITYKETFKLLKDNKLWLGYTSPEKFLQPDGAVEKILTGMTKWFTNLDIKKRHEDLILYKTYYPKYDKYDNYDAINIDKIKDIPMDYDGVMGVPITFMDKYNPEQFEILSCSAYSDVTYFGCGSLYVKNNKVYARLLIKKKMKTEELK